MKKRIVTIVTLVVLVAFVFTSCSTFVRIDTNVPANVSINGMPSEKTPVQRSLDDFIGTNYDVVITADGYETYRGRLQKELKVGALIGGIIVWPLLLWTYGPSPYQNFVLVKQ